MMIKWSDITLKQYYEIRKVLKQDEDAKVGDLVQILSIVQNKDIEQLKAMPFKQIKRELQKLNVLFEQTPNFEAVMHFEFKGEKYYIKDLADDVFAAYAAFEMVLSKFKSDDMRQVTYSLAVLARKENEEYESYELDDRAKYFESLPVETALGVASFFLSIEKASQNVISLSLQIKEKAKMLPSGLYKRIFSKSGDGLVLPMQQLLALLVLLKLKARLQIKYYSCCRFLKTKLNWMKTFLNLETSK